MTAAKFTRIIPHLVMNAFGKRGDIWRTVIFSYDSFISRSNAQVFFSFQPRPVAKLSRWEWTGATLLTASIFPRCMVRRHGRCGASDDLSVLRRFYRFLPSLAGRGRSQFHVSLERRLKERKTRRWIKFWMQMEGGQAKTSDCDRFRSSSNDRNLGEN